MNSAVRRFTLFFFSLALLASCEDPSDIGIDLQDENQIGTDYTDTLTINTGTVSQPDSILSFNQDRAILGGYWDSVLGNVKASVFTEVGLGAPGPLKLWDPEADKNKAKILDRLVLTLEFDTTYSSFGPSTDPMTFEVHRLNEGFQDKASYFTNSSLGYDEQVLGSTTFKPEFIETTDSVTKKVTRRYARPSIRLDQDFAQELFALSGRDAFKNQANFSQHLKGLAFVPTGDPRFMVGVNLSSVNTKLTLYYRIGTDTTRKSHSFTFGSSNTRDFTRITTDRSGTALADLQKNVLLPSTQTGGESYIQSGTQLFTKLTFPHLDQLKKKHGNIVINRAELILPVKNASTATLAAPKTLALYETNNSNRILRNGNGETIVVPLDAAYALNSNRYPAILNFDKTKGQYAVNITSYVQAILLGKKPNNGLLIAPAQFTTTGVGGAAAVSREIIPFRAILSNTAEKGAKLRIYFSKLD